MKKLKAKRIGMITLTIMMVFTLFASPINGITAVPEPSPSNTQPNISYDISAKLHTDDMTIIGKQTVKYRNISSDQLGDVVFRLLANAYRSQDTMPLQFKKVNTKIAEEFPDKNAEEWLGGIDIISVKDAKTGRTLRTTGKTTQALTVKLDKALNKDEEVTLELEYKTKIPFGMQRLSHYKDRIIGAYFFPVMSIYDDKTHTWNKAPHFKFETDYYEVANYKVSLDVPKQLKVVMPGRMSEKFEGAGRKLVTVNIDKTRQFVFFASEKLKKASKTENGLTVEYMYYNDNDDPIQKELVYQYINQAFKVLKFLSKKVGPYEYPEFRVVEGLGFPYGLEFSRLVAIKPASLKKEPQLNFSFVHEIVHQWFHSIIGNNSETESCLDEGFAEFYTNYFFEERGSREVAEVAGFNYIRSLSLEDVWDVPINSPNEQLEKVFSLFYEKGSLALYELYRKNGQEKFDALMQEYYKRYAYKNATVENFLQTVGDQLGSAIRVRVDECLNRPNFILHPRYRVTKEEEQQLKQLQKDRNFNRR